MIDQHYLSLGIINPKNAQNMGSILRAAGCFGVSSIFYTGNRYGYARKFHTDTHQASARIPLIGCPSILDMTPKGAVRVAVELVEGATPLPDFKHPNNGYYVFGPEDGSVDQQILDQCDACVYIPTEGCLNLAASVNILLYDRIAKRVKKGTDDGLIRSSRDNNNRAQFRPKRNI